ncbi:uncharacterized protein LOC141664858 [Apium graveolens]|uniref:uncharacterized protein LOC141664858 n=1 Tax=Apium graveolens TaxID=4045 RepID=UPI003D7B41CB
MLGFEGAIAVDSQGHSGGLAFLWRNKEDVILLSLSKNHIDVLIEMKGVQKYRLTGIYGEPDRTKRMETWALIRSLNNQSAMPWCLIGDMNNVLNQEDKKGGRPYPTWLIRGLQSVLDDCDLNDMELQGYRYTWEIGHGTDQWIEIKLDRALASSSFLQVFTEAKLSNLKVLTSDHNPLLLEPVSIPMMVTCRRFKFEKHGYVIRCVGKL